ncbi:hypothetical protein H2248_008091 [Termitomyces sp. 'cryptogamus']|nr:hypothetical protein H2248_008091 [Termitomyces sp. 'cryptogamus']
MEPHTNRQISALVALIKETANTIESHFTDSSLPSLDSLDSHALDTAVSPPLNDAIHILEGACVQLCATLARPSHTVLNRAIQFFEPICLNVVITFKIPDILQEHPLGMHIKEIGEKAGVDHQKLGQIMRLLATKHIFREVATDRFANNRLSIQLVSSNPLAGHLSLYNEMIKAAMMTVEVLRNSNQKKIEQSAWNRMTGSERSMFEYFEEGTLESERQGALFALGVRGWNNAVQAAAVLSDFPWGQYPPGTIVNDVGGGIGTMAMELIKAFPNLLLKLQDRPKRIHQAETEVWPELLPSAIAEKRIEFKAIDFFVESPIEGCDVYYLKHILLHWSDEKCVRILRNIRAVLKPSACILLHDYVLQHTNRDDTRTPQADSALTLKEAPEPLLPNYGAGHVRQYNLDIAAMVLLNGRERTIEEFVDIAGKADLRFAKLWHTGEMAVLEFHPA